MNNALTGPFAAISDVHGNRWALEAVLEDIERRGIRTILNLGDHLFGPLDIPGTADLLIGLDLPSISGNQDRDLLDPHNPTELGAPHRAWLAGLPFSLELPGAVLFHGTPLSDTVYLLETVHRDGVTLAREEEIQSRLGGGAAAQPLLLCGHSHIPRTVNCGEFLIVNPGSVGVQAYADDNPLPHIMETGSPHARYAILEAFEGGWRVDQIQITYDWDAAARAATRNGRQDWAHRLRTGRNR